MPYKEKEARLKASRESMRKKRGFVDGLTSGINKEGVNIEMVPAIYTEIKGQVYEVLPERPRYSTLSDGQVLDQATVPMTRGLFI